MKIQGSTKLISIRIMESIEFNEREASFIREMAKFCCDNNMRGCHAAEILNDLLHKAGIPEYDGNPIFGLFKE